MLNKVKSRYSSGKSGIILFILILASINTKPSYSQNYWFEDTSGVTVQLNSVVSLNQNRAWCCGNNGTVLKASQVYFFSGRRWVNVSGNGIPAGIDLVNITCPPFDTNIALTTGTIGGTTFVYRTTNAGANWVQVFSQLNGHINAMFFLTAFPETNVFMQGNPVGGRWSLWKSSNSGLNWDSAGLYLPQNGSETGWNNSILRYSSSIWFGTNNSRIYYSANSGTSWSIQSTTPEVNSYAVSGNGAVFFAGGTGLIKSTNNGVNWLSVSSMGSGNFGGFTNILAYWWYARTDNKIYMSSNNGSSWAVQYTASSGNFTHIFYNSGLIMYAIRSNGGISKYIAVVGINQISSEVPEAFKLYPNYPNPFNPSTIIRFKIKDSRFTTLKVFDILGREAETLVNEELSPGTYEINWNAENYSSGIYYYKLSSGDFGETRKMILIK